MIYYYSLKSIATICGILCILSDTVIAQRGLRRDGRGGGNDEGGMRTRGRRLGDRGSKNVGLGTNAEDVLYKAKGIRQFNKVVSKIDERQAAMTVYGAPPVRQVGYSRLGSHSALISRGPQFIPPTTLKPAQWPEPMKPTKEDMLRFSKAQLAHEIAKKTGDYMYVQPDREFAQFQDFDEGVELTTTLNAPSRPKPSAEKSNRNEPAFNTETDRIDRRGDMANTLANQFIAIPVNGPRNQFPSALPAPATPFSGLNFRPAAAIPQRATNLNRDGLFVSSTGQILSRPVTTGSFFGSGFNAGFNPVPLISSNGFARSATSPMRRIITTNSFNNAGQLLFNNGLNAARYIRRF